MEVIRKGALREQLRYRPKLHHHLGHDRVDPDPEKDGCRDLMIGLVAF
jgi:hypothetical protein